MDQLQQDVAHYQGQAEMALQEGEAWQQAVQQLYAELADKAKHAADSDDMQAEVSLLTLLSPHLSLQGP